MLNQQALSQLPSHVDTFRYDRSALQSGIVHLGVGAFHKAHMAWYLDQYLDHDPSDWTIIGASFRGKSVRDDLASQDYLYSVLVKDNQQAKHRVIGAIREVIFVPEAVEQLLLAIAQPSTKIVSLTVTEKGYCHEPATGQLDTNRPEISHDLNALESPQSVIGVLVQALRLCYQQGGKPFVVLSCDNLPSNGKLLRQVILDFAHIVDPNLEQWIAENVAFPCSMVDRIVPRTQESSFQELEASLGTTDMAGCVTEGFSQWVVEDQFPQGRPALEKVGVQFVEDVTPYETMKLRLLNGTHSAIAYVGQLLGYEFVYETMEDLDFKNFILTMMLDEILPSLLSLGTEEHLRPYCHQLIQRYENKNLLHRTLQIAMDGSQKIPQRWLNTLQYQRQQNGRIHCFSVALAAWIKFTSGKNLSGDSVEVNDPMASVFQEIWQSSNDLQSVVHRYFGLRSVFSEELGNDLFLQNTVVDVLTLIEADQLRENLLGPALNPNQTS